MWPDKRPPVGGNDAPGMKKYGLFPGKGLHFHSLCLLVFIFPNTIHTSIFIQEFVQ
jgi:hypothetical protein